MAANLFGLVRKALTKSLDPNSVEEVPISSFETWPVKRREDCLQLKGPYFPDKPGSGGVKFASGSNDEVVQVGNFAIIVLSSTNLKNCYSVLTTSDAQEAERLFDTYQRILPAFLAAKPELCNKSDLQKLCDSARDHPDWGLCHIAVDTDMIGLVSTQDTFKKEMNSVDSAGVTAIMVAVSKGSKHLVTGLVDNGADLRMGCDILGNNVMHYVAKQPVIILDLLVAGKHYESEVIVDLLNKRNNDKKTPLHIACDDEKSDLVLAMLKQGADVNNLALAEDVTDEDNHPSKVMPQTSGSFKDILTQFPKGFYEKDIKFGGTPLHWANDKGAMDALIQLGCDIEARNNHGEPAVHKMISHKRLSCVVVLLSHGADVDSRDANGNTPLHKAMELGHIPSIQALVVFNAKYTIKNKDGDNPWMVALKTHQAKFSNVYKDIVAERNMMLHTLHSVGANGPKDINTTEEFDWTPPITDSNRLYKRSQHTFDEFIDRTLAGANRSNGEVRVLSLDGGGIRGLVLAKMLECLCKESKKTVREMFDWISGTSTGGILALALARKKTPIECQCLYFKLKDKVFVGNRPYNAELLEEFLKAELTDNLTMSDLPRRPFIAVTATIGDRFPPDLHLFRNYESPMDMLGHQEVLPPNMPSPKKPDQQLIWRAARSSGAAPSYFRASGRFIDGGLVANNPTLDILTEINQRNLALKSLHRTSEMENIGIVVSLGTGECPLEKQLPPDVFVPNINPMEAYQSMQGAAAMARMLVEQACSATNRVVDRARSWCSMANISFFRLSPLLAKDIDLDTTDDTVLVEMLWMTQSYMHQNRAKIKQIVEILNKCSSDAQ